MDQIVFLGTGGARVVVSKQIRASGGMWFSLRNTQFIVDPGPGALVRATGKRKPKLDPAKLDAIILSHRHLDHAADVNVMIEAMTAGGREKRGQLLLPRDTLTEDPIVYRYMRDRVSEIAYLEAGGSYHLGEVTVSTPVRHIHSEVETYGLNLHRQGTAISYIADTRFFPELIDHYRGDVLIINLVRYTEPEGYELDHLNLDDARQLIGGIRPQTAILTHFGMTMIRARPWEVAARLEQETGVHVIAARDGMRYELTG